VNPRNRADRAAQHPTSDTDNCPVNVTVETLAPCKKLVRFELDAAAVDAAFEAVTTEFLRHAKMPGFRPGKAPKDMVARQYAKEIEEEAKRKLLGDSYRQGIKDQNLNVLGYPDIEEIQFARGQALQFAATVEIRPEFDLPSYRGLPAKRESAAVSDTDVTKAIDALRGQMAEFKTADRPAGAGDIAVVNYTGACEGKPITDLAPTARGLTENKNFWIEMRPDAFIPGFSEQLTGARAGEKRTVTVNFPADFVTPQLAGKQGVFEVEVLEVKEKVLPELNDTMAKAWGADTLDKLHEGVRRDLQNEANQRQKRAIRNQLARALTELVQFDLPETSLQVETRNVVYEMVSENQRRGVPKEVIEAKKDEIYNAASAIARERVKIGFLFHRISEKEGISVNQTELQMRVAALAQINQMPADKFLKELEKQERLPEIYQQIVHDKVLDFLHEHAKIEDLPAPVAAS
jgi:trigger factor